MGTNQRKTKNSKRQVWDGDKKICKDCSVAKNVTEFNSRGKYPTGKIKYEAKCKACTKPRAETRARNFKFNCKQCGKASDHYDKRHTTFCSRECGFAYKQGEEEYIKVDRNCKHCGKERTREEYKKGIYCEPCKEEIELEKAEKEKQIQIEQEQIRLEKEKAKKAKILRAKIEKEQKRIEREKNLNKVCNSCNTPFKAKSLQAKICPTCRKLREFYRDITRGKRSTSILPIDITRFDADITLSKLIKRDKNICHICSKKCDSNDFTYHENGAYVAGLNHPSEDHVIPLANGGTHTWDNVKLAHKRCNSLKNDYDIDESKKQLEFFL